MPSFPITFGNLNSPIPLSDLDQNFSALTDQSGAANKGSNLIGQLGTSTGELPTFVGPYLNLMVKGLKKNFGCVGDGVTDNYIQMNKAFQTSGKIIEIEDGTFLYNTALTPPTCSSIIGWGSNNSSSILKPGTSVTSGLSITGAGAPSLLRGFEIVGNSASNARGLIIGDGVLTAGQLIQSVYVHSFTGTSAVALDVNDAVSVRFDQCIFSRSSQNIRLRTGSVSGTPTTITFASGTCELATNEGAVIYSGYGISFESRFIFQTNGKEGLLLNPTSDNILSFKVSDVWFESNWYSLVGSPATRLTKYSLNSFGTGSTIQLTVDGGKFDTATKSINIGTNNSGFLIKDPQLGNLTGALTITDGYGGFSIPLNLNADSVVSITNPGIALNLNLANPRKQNPSYAASYTPDFGLGGYTINVGTLTGNITVNNPTSSSFPAQGQRVVFSFTQDATGARTVSWDTNYVFPTAWTNTGNTAGKKSTIEFISDGTKLIASGANVWY